MYFVKVFETVNAKITDKNSDLMFFAIVGRKP